jgi:hypothetical protein
MQVWEKDTTSQQASRHERLHKDKKPEWRFGADWSDL